MSIDSYIRAAPKAELHVHLEGAVQPATLLELARRNRVALPAETVEGLREWFAFRDFAHFIEVYVAITRCLRTVEDYELVTYELGAELARQHVRYAEVTFSPSTHAWLGVPQEVWFEGLTRGRMKVAAAFGVTIAWVFDIVRDTDHVKADYVTGVAIDGRADGVVALGLGGSEQGHPPEPFAPCFERARAGGLHSTPHAGEHAGPESIWGALRALGAERIDHGVRALEDPSLVAHLAARRIPLNICPTSNLRLGVVADLARHSLRDLHRQGVAVTINTDDPPLFNTTLNDEAALLADPFGFDLATIDEILLHGIRAAFLPTDRGQELEAAVRSDLDALRPLHLGEGR